MPERFVLFALLTAWLLVVPGVGAQQVTGRVVDQQTGQPIAAVQVFIPGAGIGALSQQNGRYLLLNVPAGTYTLSAQRIGYREQTAEITVAAGATVVRDFALSEEALGLDEIIVTGTPGGTQRRAIGNAVTVVDVTEITQVVAVSGMQELLAGRSPGLQFTRSVGNLGTGSALELRGVSSLSLRSDPLIYVDGIRVNNDAEAGPGLGQGTRSGPGRGEVNVLNDFNPQDIESIEIIKGPAAATLYGTEASAGVIQIITKRGVEGTPEFNVSVRQGINYIRDPAGRIGKRWACRDSFKPPCDESTGLFSYNPYDEANALVHEGGWFPWPTKNLFQNGYSQSYNVDVRGGTPTIRYFLSANADDGEAFVTHNTNNAFRLRANVSVVFNENFSLDVSTGYVDGLARFASPVRRQGGIWEDLNWGNGYCLPRINRDACPRLIGFQEHLPSDAAKVESTRDFDRFTGSGTLNFSGGDWLSSKLILGIDRGHDENTVYFPLETELSPVYGESVAGEITVSRPVNTNWSVDASATASYDLTDSWSTATSVGGQFYKKTQSEFLVRGVGFPSPLSRTVNQTPAASSTINYTFVDNRSLGFYVQEALSWNDRVFLTAAVRLDDNSAFGTNFEPVTYPKFSGTWVVSEESFWGVDLVNSLRLRGAWGRAGRQPDVFAGQNQYGVTSGPGGLAIFDPLSPGDLDVGPEISTELELGFDVALLDDRVAAEFTWYTQKNEDALLAIPLAPSVGFAGAVDRNVGRIDNWGWEATLRNRIYESEGLSFRLDLTASHVENEVKDIGSLTGTSTLRIGWPYPGLGLARDIVSAEVDPNGPLVDILGRRISATCYAPVSLGGNETQFGRVRGGMIPCADVNNLGELILQGPQFDTYVYSVAPSISLLNNSLVIHALADGHYGKKGRSVHGGAGCSLFHNCRPAKTVDPLYTASRAYTSSGSYSFDHFDASFWKLRQIGVRYSLPESLTSGIGAARAALSLSANEVAILWMKQPVDRWGGHITDPEVGKVNRADCACWTTAAPISSVDVVLRVTF